VSTSGSDLACVDTPLKGASRHEVAQVDVAAVIGWGLPRLRDLPWRATRDPWAVLVSEVMAQQTQVARVVPKWLEFMEIFPTPTACAAAPLGDVLRLWQGLGYPRRARNLHAAAGKVTELGRFPDTLEGLRSLPGVGPYTARAVLAFAFEIEAAVVDTNVARVLARVVGRTMTAQQVQHLADALLPAGEPWAWNQCLMELGAVLCRPAAPECSLCPLMAQCAWAHDPARPDPSIGSAGVSTRQARFEGSDRQARGALLRALAAGPVRVGDVARVVARPPEVAERIVAGVLADGLCVGDDELGVLLLP
jgi:A/G-specific adenine glycosylase